MKGKVIGVVLLIVTVSMLVVLPKDIAAIPTTILSDASTHNDVLIDGSIGNDWFDGNKTLTTDHYGDEAWGTGGAWGLNDLYTSLNATGFAVGLNASLQGASNGFLVFFDTDNGATGVTDHNTADAWNRNAVFENGFKTNWFLGTWGLSPWDLRNFTVEDGTTFTYVPGDSGYNASTGNVSTAAGSSIVHYEAFIPWSLFYPAGIPANAEIHIVAAMFGGGGGDSPADLIPNSFNSAAPEKVSNYALIEVDADGDSNPELTPEPSGIGWAGNEADNSFGGLMPKGFLLEFKISVWYGSHDHPNASDWATFKVKYHDYSAMMWSSWTNVSMTHVVGDYEGNNDWYRLEMDTGGFDENDTLTWMIETGYGPTAEYNVTIGPLPPVDIEEISAVEPSGGFILPGQLINITANVGQLLNGTTFIHQPPGTVVTLYWETNMSGTWNTKDFTFLEEAGTQADKFNVSIGPYMYPTNVTFYINASNNNSVTTANISLFVLVPPPESQVFSMTDPQGDEYGVYPTDVSFAPYEGLLDLLNFTVTSNEWVTTFHFKMYNNSNPWSGPTGFSHPTFMVMVDNAPGGSTDSYGNAYVNTDIEWDHGFQVTSWEKWYWNDSTNVVQSGTGISINTDLNDTTDTYWISFSVPASLIGSTADTSWKYVVMVGSNDYTNYRQHNAAPEAYVFGGGVDGDIDPNYVDILVPEGGNSTWLQEYITYGYDIPTSTRTTVMAVGPGISFVEDVTDPVAAFTAPADASEFTIVSGTTYDVTFDWTVSDPADATIAGLDYLEFFVDGVLQPSISLADSSTVLSLSEGAHTIRINVYDLTGNYGSAIVTVTIHPQEVTTTTETTTTTTTTTEAPTTEPTTEPTTTEDDTPGFALFSILAMLGFVTLYIRRRR